MANKRTELLAMAEKLVNGDRNVQYGDPRADFLRTADLWEAYLNGAHDRHLAEDEERAYHDLTIEPHEVAILLMLLKISRLAWSPDKEDTWADIAGYAACGWDCIAPEEAPLTEEDEAKMAYDAFVADYAEDQDDIALDVEETEAAIEWLHSLLTTPPKAPGGYLNATLFGNRRP